MQSGHDKTHQGLAIYDDIQQFSLLRKGHFSRILIYVESYSNIFFIKVSSSTLITS